MIITLYGKQYRPDNIARQRAYELLCKNPGMFNDAAAWGIAIDEMKKRMRRKLLLLT